MSDRITAVTFEALIVKNDDPLVVNRVYVDAETVDEALDMVYQQRHSDYYTAWVSPYEPPACTAAQPQEDT